MGVFCFHVVGLLLQLFKTTIRMSDFNSQHHLKEVEGAPRLSVVMRLLIVSLLLLVLALTIGMSKTASANSSPDAGQLKIHGNINFDEGKERILDMDYLRSLEPTSIKTDTPWTNGVKTFTGVRISTLLENIGATSNNFEAIALNDYRFTLSEIDFEKYPVIIAYEIDGEPLTVRTLGPLWIMFPFDDYPELSTQRNRGASVWQLIELKIL